MSLDGNNVYVARGNLVRLDRNTTSGGTIQPAGSTGCIFNDGSGAVPMAARSTGPASR
ncbi:MAG TPA: hypothetical protein VN458_08715 [Solirubrobacterales bacterium]|nr:hypothetical protein [Solirubrobacterales bacterium]